MTYKPDVLLRGIVEFGTTFVPKEDTAKFSHMEIPFRFHSEGGMNPVQYFNPVLERQEAEALRKRIENTRAVKLSCLREVHIMRGDVIDVYCTLINRDDVNQGCQIDFVDRISEEGVSERYFSALYMPKRGEGLLV